MSNGILRLLTALIGIPIVLFISYVGGWWFGAMMIAASIAAQYELYRMMACTGVFPMVIPGLVLGILLSVGFALPPAFPLAATLVLLMIAAVPLLPTKGSVIQSLGGTLFGAVYPTMFLSYLWHLRTVRGPGIDDIEAFHLTIAVLVFVWSSDTFAYYSGKTLGKHPLAPTVSPKKTWEGSIGGAVGAVIIAVVFKLTILSFLAWGHVLVMAAICGIIGQFGDLAESKMKRVAGIKDSGGILPGHGGLLDRLDALILAAPLVFLYLNDVASLFEN